MTATPSSAPLAAPASALSPAELRAVVDKAYAEIAAEQQGGIDAIWAGLAAKVSGAKAAASGAMSAPLSRERREPAASRSPRAPRAQAEIDAMYREIAAELNATLPRAAWLPAGAPGARG